MGWLGWCATEMFGETSSRRRQRLGDRNCENEKRETWARAHFVEDLPKSCAEEMCLRKMACFVYEWHHFGERASRRAEPIDCRARRRGRAANLRLDECRSGVWRFPPALFIAYCLLQVGWDIAHD